MQIPGFSKLSTRSRRAKLAVTAVVLVALYGLLGYFAVGPILRSQAARAIAQATGRHVVIAKVRFYPFALSLAVKGLRVDDADGTPLAGFDELYANFQLSSLFRRALTFREIRLDGPFFDVKLGTDGRPSFADLLPDGSQAEPAAEPAGGFPPLLAFSLRIHDGRLGFSDASKTPTFETKVAPIEITLEDFSTRKDALSPYAFKAAIGENETIEWEGDFSVNPLRSNGRLAFTGLRPRMAWSYFQERLRFEVTAGVLDAAARYSLDAAGDTLHLDLRDGSIGLHDFALGRKGAGDAVISIPSLKVEGVRFDLGERRTEIASIDLREPSVSSWLEPKTGYNLATLFTPQEPATGSQPAPVPAPAEKASPPPDAPPWRLVVKETRLHGGTFGFEDRSTSPPFSVRATDIDLGFRDYSTEPGVPFQVSLQSRINDGGQIQANGTMGARPLFAKLDVELSGLPLVDAQPYVGELARMNVTAGAARAKGALAWFPDRQGEPLVRFQGDVGVSGLTTHDADSGHDFVGWDDLALAGLALSVDPTSVGIQRIDLRKPKVAVRVDADGRSNVSGVFGSGDEAPAESATPDSEKPEEGSRKTSITVGTFQLEGGTIEIVDASVKPTFTSTISELDGVVRGLSSAEDSKADIELAGKLNRHAPIKIAGRIDPFAAHAFLDLTASCRGIETTLFTPYAGKYAGYTVDKGKLSLDLRYRVANDLLKADNKIVLDQLTLGSRTESPQATTLPVPLAIALLKDLNGRIDVDLPVTGNLTDPAFSFGGVILKAVTGLIAQAATAPFNLLGSILGIGSEELSYIEFDAGSATLSQTAADKLDGLARALTKRPALRLEIKGRVSQGGDVRALKRARLIAELTGRKPDATQLEPLTPETAGLTPKEYASLISKAYAKRFGSKPAEALLEPAKTADGAAAESTKGVTEEERRARITDAAETRLLEDVPLDETALRGLAERRADAVKDHLRTAGQVDESRLFLVDPGLRAPDVDGRVRTRLFLATGR